MWHELNVQSSRKPLQQGAANSIWTSINILQAILCFFKLELNTVLLGVKKLSVLHTAALTDATRGIIAELDITDTGVITGGAHNIVASVNLAVPSPKAL